MQHLQDKSLSFQNLKYVQPLAGNCHNILKMGMTVEAILDIYPKEFSCTFTIIGPTKGSGTENKSFAEKS